MVSLSALLQVLLEGEASQFAQLLPILAFVVAAFALIAAASPGCINHTLPEPLLKRRDLLQRPARPSRSKFYRLRKIRGRSSLYPNPLAG